jgi:hypothetical protein
LEEPPVETRSRFRHNQGQTLIFGTRPLCGENVTVS